MSYLVIVLILISAIIHSFWNFILKKAIDDGADSEAIYWIAAAAGVAIYSLFFWFLILQSVITFKGVWFAALVGFFTAIYLFTLSKSYEHGDLSHVYPLAKITPLFTLIFGIFILKEVVTLMGMIGILLIVFGAYSIHLKGFRIKNIIEPLAAIPKHKASIFALATAIISAIYGLFTKIGLGAMDALIFVYIAYMFAVIFYLPFLHIKKPKIISQIRKFKKPILLIGFLDLISFGLYAFALSLSQLSYVFALRQVSILFSVFAGIYILKEGYGKTRVAASILILIGIILVGLSV